MKKLLAFTILFFGYLLGVAFAAGPIGGGPIGGGGIDLDYLDERYAGLAYGIMWNENQDTYIRIGDPYLFIHDDMKRCILADNGTVVYYLDGYNREGVDPSTTGTCDATATKKLKDTGAFTNSASDYVGHYAHNKTDDTYSLITAKDDNDTLSLQDDIFVSGEEFEICTGVFNGDDGQVMVEIPAFYHKYWYDNGWHGHSISYSQLPGYELHHAFQKNGANVTARYIGAYEGVLYDTSEGKYVNGLYLPYNSSYKMTFDGTAETITSDTLTHPFTNLEAGVDTIVVSGTVNNDGTYGITAVTDITITVDGDLENETSVACTIQTQRDWNNDILSSVAGKAPIINGTRANFRTVAANRGTGWRQQDFDIISAVQLLCLIEYGSWYSQSEIGIGLTDWNASAWSAWNNYNPIERTGLSNGTATWSVSNGNGNKGSYVSYRWIENPWGHIRKFVDGININNHVPYVCNDDTNFADDTSTNYTSLGVTLANNNGWQKTLVQTARGFLPASVGGSSSTYVTDYYYQNAGWRIMLLGGDANRGESAGAFYIHAYYNASQFAQYLGSRSSF
mgnify:CR=1 FL=1